MDLIKHLIKNAKRHHWGDGCKWLGWTIVGGFLPLWATLIGLRVTKQHPTFGSVSSKGEFALYTAALCAGALFLVLRDFKLKDIKRLRDLKRALFPNMPSLSIVLVGLLAVSSVLFAFVCLLDVLGDTGKPELLELLDRPFLTGFSTLMIAITVPLSFIVVVADSSLGDFDPQEIANEEWRDLNKDFETLN